jgi:hypothetical protein
MSIAWWHRFSAPTGLELSARRAGPGDPGRARLAGTLDHAATLMGRLVEGCRCRKLCHPMRPGRFHGSGRRAGPGAEYACPVSSLGGCTVRRVGSAAASGAADGCCSGRRTRRGPAAGGVRRVISIRSRHSRRALPTQRSAIAFARGAWRGLLMIRAPTAVNTASDAAVNLASRSRIKNLKPSAWPSRIISRLRACWVTKLAGPSSCTRHQVSGCDRVIGTRRTPRITATRLTR